VRNLLFSTLSAQPPRIYSWIVILRKRTTPNNLCSFADSIATASKLHKSLRQAQGKLFGRQERVPQVTMRLVSFPSDPTTGSLPPSYGIRRIFSIHRCAHTESIDSRESIPINQCALRTREESHENSKAGGLIYVTKKNHAFICITFLRDLGRGTSGPRRRSAWNFRNSGSDIARHTSHGKHGAASDGQHGTTANRQHARSEHGTGIESDQSERARRQFN
jgi:hypothetical protein